MRAPRGGRACRRASSTSSPATASTSRKVALADPDLAGIHFTGSTPTFQSLWQQVGANIASYRTYPRLVGETGGKDFVLAHPSADPDVLRTALVRGAFEYQGQKCSAASRAYVPASLWKQIKGDLASITDGLPMGDVTDFSNFMGAVIDERSFDEERRGHRPRAGDVRRAGRRRRHLRPLRGLVRPADGARGRRPRRTRCSRTEYFGPILAVHVYPDRRYDAVLDQMESVAPYALTGAVIATDRAAIADATSRLRFAAGNFYVNDKPTGAVVGQQPFGGGRASGHERQGRRRAEPAALDQRPVDQGDVRRPDERRLPAHGVTVRRRRATPGRPRAPC